MRSTLSPKYGMPRMGAVGNSRFDLQLKSRISFDLHSKSVFPGAFFVQCNGVSLLETRRDAKAARRALPQCISSRVLHLTAVYCSGYRGRVCRILLSTV